MYKAYSMDESFQQDEGNTIRICSGYTEDFDAMFEGHIEKNSENFLREIMRNLISGPLVSL